MTNGSADQRTLLQRWKYQLEQKPLIAALMLLFGILVAFSGGWRIVVGDHLWESISSYINVENGTLEECINSVNDTELEILKCKTKFGVPL